MKRIAIARAIALCATMAVACQSSTHHDPPAAAAIENADPLAPLRSFEDEQRASTRFLETPTQDRAFGTDPYDLAQMRDRKRVVGILRGRDALVLLDSTSLREVARVPTLRSPSAVAVYEGAIAGVLHPGDVLVASEVVSAIAHYRPRDDGGVDRLADIPLDGVYGTRDIATGPEGVIYIVEEHDDRLITLRFGAHLPDGTPTATAAPATAAQVVPRGPLRVSRTRHALFVLSLLEHSISVFTVDRHGVASSAPAALTRIDGPYWGFDVVETNTPTADGDALIVAGGVEDHPLDRRGGFFGYVDSFVYAYRWSARSPGELRKTAEINVGELGLIVPKAIAFAFAPRGKREALVTSYGGAKAARLTWTDGDDAPPRIESFDAAPGSSALVATANGLFVAANPLLDAWVVVGNDDATAATSTIVHPRPHSDEPDTRTDRERIGEALFFTGLMAPASSSDGAASRFTCETCHFEGYVDGRIHHTGRGDVHAVTKPLVGLFNNRPHFSRALDPDLSSVAENEFRVAGAPSASNPHFDIDTNAIPWLRDLPIKPGKYDSTELRLSLMSFLMKWTHRSNPRAVVARPFTDEERVGAAAFRDRCERCHEARAASDVPESRVSFDRWESLIFGDGSIVWASDAYKKTGVMPYVHESGARVPSLRRLYKKRPYFTNGSAPTVLDVIHRARFHGDAFMHDDGATAAAGDAIAIDEPTARALAAFVDLL